MLPLYVVCVDIFSPLVGLGPVSFNSKPCPSLALACVIGTDSHKMHSRLLTGFDQCQAHLEYWEEAGALGREKPLDIHICLPFPFSVSLYLLENDIWLIYTSRAGYLIFETQFKTKM